MCLSICLPVYLSLSLSINLSTYCPSRFRLGIYLFLFFYLKLPLTLTYHLYHYIQVLTYSTIFLLPSSIYQQTKSIDLYEHRLYQDLLNEQFANTLISSRLKAKQESASVEMLMTVDIKQWAAASAIHPSYSSLL